jgi:hypothetical protein
MITIAVALSVIFVFTACNSSKNIVKGYQSAGYTVNNLTVSEDSEIFSELEQIFGAETARSYIGYPLYHAQCPSTNIVKSAMIVEFPSASKLKKALANNYDKYVKDGKINGNCLLMSNWIGNDTKQIFTYN